MHSCASLGEQALFEREVGRARLGKALQPFLKYLKVLLGGHLALAAHHELCLPCAETGQLAGHWHQVVAVLLPDDNSQGHHGCKPTQQLLLKTLIQALDDRLRRLRYRRWTAGCGSRRLASGGAGRRRSRSCTS